MLLRTWVKNRGEDSLSPGEQLESGRNRPASVTFVALSTMTLTAELRGLVRARSAAGRVVRAADEEHGRVGSYRQTRLALGSDRKRVHDVLVMAGCALNCGLLVVCCRSDKEAIVLHKLRGIGTVHQDLAGAVDAAIPVIGSAVFFYCFKAH